jgi:hypothetical protein
MQQNSWIYGQRTPIRAATARLSTARLSAAKSMSVCDLRPTAPRPLAATTRRRSIRSSALTRWAGLCVLADRVFGQVGGRRLHRGCAARPAVQIYLARRPGSCRRDLLGRQLRRQHYGPGARRPPGRYRGPNDQGFSVDGTVAKVRGMVSASPGPCPFPGSIPVLAERVPDHFSDNKT